MNLPWHKSLWQQILCSWQQNRLPHALLLSGAQGMGKSLFVENLAHILLCEHFHPSNHEIPPQACGVCKSCLLFHSKNHPDLHWVQPAEIGKPIQVDQVRHLIDFSALTPHYNRYRIVIIQPAESMNRNAANSLLKLLEEPPPSTLLMLVSHQHARLLATIRSRCQRLDFSHPDKTIAESWLNTHISEKTDVKLLLNLSAQAPLAAQALSETGDMEKRQQLFESLRKIITDRVEPVSTAMQWDKLGAIQVLSWMLSWTMDLIRWTLTQQSQFIINKDYLDTLKTGTKGLNTQHLFTLLDLQYEAYRLMMGGSSVKAQSLLENIAISWLELKKLK